MTTIGKSENSTLRLAVILVLVAHCARSTEGFRLRKSERRGGRREAADGFQPGKIVFGNVFERGSGVDAQPRDGGRDGALDGGRDGALDGSQTSSASAEEDSSYQGDSPVLQTQVPPEMKFMDPSVLCGLDKMKFMAQGADAQRFAMDPGPAARPVPLSQVPIPCGYNVQRDPPSLAMMAPYSGCFMLQQGAYYVLPMRWQDTQFSLWCPMPPVVQPTPAQTTRPPQVPRFHPPYFLPPWNFPPGIAPQVPQVPQIPQVPQVPQIPQVPQVPQIPQVPQVPHIPQVPQVPHIPQIPHIPFPKFPPWNPYPEPVTPPPSTVPPTVTLPPPSKTGAQQPFPPLFYPLPHPIYAPSFPWGIPMFPPVAEPPVKTKPAQVPPSSFSYANYPYSIPPVFQPFPQPPGKQTPGKVGPPFPPYVPFPLKLMRYPSV